MTWADIRNADWFEKFVIAVLVTALLRVFLPIISIVLIAGVGLFLVVLVLDAAAGGTALLQVSNAIYNWIFSII